MEYNNRYDYIYSGTEKSVKRKKFKPLLIILLIFTIFFIFMISIILFGLFGIKLKGELLLPGGVTSVSEIVSIEGVPDEHLDYNGLYAYSTPEERTIASLIVNGSKNEKGEEFVWSSGFSLFSSETTSKYNKELNSESIEEEFNIFLFKYSVETATIIAYNLAESLDIYENVSIDYEVNGVIIYKTFQRIEGINIGDKITKVNNIEVNDNTHFNELIETGDCKKTFSLTVETEDEQRKFIDSPICHRNIFTKTNYKIIQTTPKITYKYSDNYQGDSMGMMLTLGIYNGLTNSLYKGTVIAGTGTIERNGNVSAIGAVLPKTMAAYQNNVKILIVAKSNEYEFINSLKFLQIENEMVIIAVNDVEEAILKLVEYNNLGVGNIWY